MKKFFGNREVILMLALVLGLAAGRFAVFTEKLVLPALGLVMTLSVLGVPGSIFRSGRAWLRPTLAAIFCNFILLGGLLVGLSHFLIGNQEIRDGFIIMATVPPAVAVMPFTVILRGDQAFSLIGTIGSYLSALILTPLLAVIFLGGGVVIQPWDIAIIVAELIAVPLVLSRLLQGLGWVKKLEPWKGTITNWSFFIITFTIVGLNRQFMFHQTSLLLPVLFIAVASTFVWGEVVERICRWRGLPQPLTVSLILLSTLKNYGLAGGLALTLFSSQTSVPAAVSTVFMISYIIWLNIKRRWVWSEAPEIAEI